MRTLNDAKSAAKSLGHAIGGQQQQHADIIGDALGALNDRLTAIEAIISALAMKTGLTSADVLSAVSPTQNAHSDIRRILRS